MRLTNSQVQIWYPVGFVAALSLCKLLLHGGAGDPAFYCFLPFCFLGVANAQATLLRRVEALEQAKDRSPSVDAPREAGAR